MNAARSPLPAGAKPLLTLFRNERPSKMGSQNTLRNHWAFLLFGLGGLCVERVLIRLVGAFPPDALLFQLGIWPGAIYNLAADYGEKRYRAADLFDRDSHIVL